MKTNTKASIDWLDTKVGDNIMGMWEPGDEFTVADISKIFRLRTSTARMYLSKGCSQGYVKHLGGETYTVVHNNTLHGTKRISPFKGKRRTRVNGVTQWVDKAA